MCLEGGGGVAKRSHGAPMFVGFLLLSSSRSPGPLYPQYPKPQPLKATKRIYSEEDLCTAEERPLCPFVA